MIEGSELIIYLNDESSSISLSPTQTEVIFKALGLEFNNENRTVTFFSDSSLKENILPRINFAPLIDKESP